MPALPSKVAATDVIPLGGATAFPAVLGKTFAFGRNVALLLIMSLALGSCHAKAGDACKSMDESRCLDEKTALECHDGKLFPAACHGSKGCTGSGAALACDISGDVDGDRCGWTTEDCSADGKKKITCEGDWIKARPCVGANACKKNGGSVECTTGYAVGEPCRDPGELRCSADGSAMVLCSGGKFALARTCDGPRRCDFNLGARPYVGIWCDGDSAEPGWPCNADVGKASCAKKRDRMMKCEGGRWQPAEACPPDQPCASIQDPKRGPGVGEVACGGHRP